MLKLPIKVCDDCEHSDEVGMCEANGAHWNGKKWTPTDECKPSKTNNFKYYND